MRLTVITLSGFSLQDASLGKFKQMIIITDYFYKKHTVMNYDHNKHVISLTVITLSGFSLQDASLGKFNQMITITNGFIAKYQNKIMISI